MFGNNKRFQERLLAILQQILDRLPLPPKAVSATMTLKVKEH